MNKEKAIAECISKLETIVLDFQKKGLDNDQLADCLNEAICNVEHYYNNDDE